MHKPCWHALVRRGLAFAWRPQFGIRALFALVTVCALVTGYIAAKLRNAADEARAVDRLDSVGVSIFYEPRSFAGVNISSKIPAWAWRTFGKAAFADSTRANINGFADDDVIADDEDLVLLQKFTKLSYVDLFGMVLSPKTLLILSRLQALETLSIDESTLPEAGLSLLQAAPRLTRLDLRSGGVTDASLHGCGALKYISCVDLFGCDEVSADGIREIAQIKSLQQLSIKACDGIDDSAIRQLVVLPHLQELEIENADISNDACQSLAEIKDLRKLSLHACPVNDDGVAYLCTLAELRELDLSSTDVSGKSIPALGKLRRLETLDLRYTMQDAASLQSMAGLSKLRQLFLGPGCDVNDVKALKQRLPECKIVVSRSGAPAIVL